jgi:hypothetical protein
MAIDECTAHKVKAESRCPVCIKPLCRQCIYKDGTCSEVCFTKRQRYGTGTGAAKPAAKGTGLVRKLVLLGVIAFVLVIVKRLGFLPI